MGTSICGDILTDIGRDHPHAYGDKHLTACAVPFVSGSSPRVWGQEYPKPPKGDFERIIPTRMGTSFVLVKFGN